MKRKKKAPISFELFKECMEALVKENQYIDQCNKLDIHIFENLYCGSMLVKLMDTLFGGFDNVDWWCYEKDYGKRKDMDVILSDGTIIPSETIEDLYKLICFCADCECILDE